MRKQILAMIMATVMCISTTQFCASAEKNADAADDKTYTLGAEQITMIYVPEEDISPEEELDADKAASDIAEDTVTEKQDEFFNDCSTNYAFKQLGLMENGKSLQTLYIDIAAALEKIYYSDEDIELSSLGDYQVYCGAEVNYGDLNLSGDELFEVYISVFNDHPMLYFENNMLLYSETTFYLLVADDFIDGDVRSGYVEQIKNLQKKQLLIMRL
jgi:hypothetical protein